MLWPVNAPADFCLLLANGEPPSIELFKSYYASARHFIAVDGASTWARQHNVVPDLILGDLDSSDMEFLKQVPVLHTADQESNDLEKALAYCVEQLYERVLVLGAFGRRADHFLTNIYGMKKFARRLEIIFVDDNQVALICPLNKTVLIINMKNAYLSLFPLENQVGPISTTGVQYTLHREMLSINSRIGTLNKIVDDRATVLCEAGDLLMMAPNTHRQASSKSPSALSLLKL